MTEDGGREETEDRGQRTDGRGRRTKGHPGEMRSAVTASISLGKGTEGGGQRTEVSERIKMKE